MAAQLDQIEDFVRIRTPDEWRGLLMSAAVAVIDARLTVSQANAIVGLSQEVHKSIRQEFEMRCYVAENITLSGGTLKRLPKDAS